MQTKPNLPSERVIFTCIASAARDLTALDRVTISADLPTRIIIDGQDTSPYLTLRAQRTRMSDNRLGELSGKVQVVTHSPTARRKLWRQRRDGTHDYRAIAQALLLAIEDAAKGQEGQRAQAHPVPPGAIGMKM